MSSWKTWTAAAACLLVLCLATPPASAGELAGVKMADSVDVGGHQLVLNGMGLRTKLIFKVYVAGLYLPAKQSDAAAILAADAPRHVVMEFVRSVDKGKICDGWKEGLEANTPGASAEVKKQFDTLCSWLQDVKSGDQYVYTYIPGQGTEVSLKGTSLGTLEGKEFADALFSCWLGKEPPGEDFKKGLLGS